MSASSWSLATVETAAGPVACIETEQGLFALEPSLARVGLPDCRTVISLFEDWSPLGSSALACCRQPRSGGARRANAAVSRPCLRARSCVRARTFRPGRDGNAGGEEGGAAAVLLHEAASQCRGRRGRHRPYADGSGSSTGKSNLQPSSESVHATSQPKRRWTTWPDGRWLSTSLHVTIIARPRPSTSSIG